MLKLFILSFLLTSASFAQSQDDQDQFYSIENLGDQYSKAFIENAIEKANMCGFFYNDTRRKMIFDDGAVVYLNSAIENVSIEDECADVKNQDDNKEYWEISDSGHLIRRVNQVTKS